jgi:V8-like Glu-specific endopeptidase
VGKPQALRVRGRLMNVRVASIVLFAALALGAGAFLEERFALRPLAWMSRMMLTSSAERENGAAFVRFLPSCFGQAAIYSCASVALPNPEDVFPQIEPLSNFDSQSRFIEAARSVGRLDFLVDIGGGNRAMDACSAFLISERYVMTAFHCTLDMNSNKMKMATAVFLRLGYTSDSRSGALRTGQRYEIACGEVGCRPVEANQSLDFAIFELKPQAATKAQADGFKPVKMGTTLDELAPAPGQDSFVIHHPFGREQFITRAFCHVTTVDPLASRFFDTCATLGGSSGAPIFDERSQTVIGMRIQGDIASAVEAKFLAAGVPLASIASQSPIVRSLLATPR